MTKSKRRIVLVDDEPNAMKYYTKGLRERGFAVELIESADSAWEFFSAPQPTVTAIVLDIMMPPGKHFAHTDHNEGLRTGVYIFLRILETQLTADPTGSVLTVAVLTNVGNPETIEALEKVRARGGDRVKLRIWPKMNTSPLAFAEQLWQWLDDLGRLA